MIAHHVHDALSQVRRLQSLLLERSMFEGYSGKARAVSGIVTLINTVVLASALVPRTPAAHLAAWAITLAVALLLNYVALIWWFLFDPRVRRNPRMLKPAVDAVPALAVGAVLSLATILAGQYQFLFGIWMCLYGLAQVAYRQSLPRGIYAVGLAYLIAGAVCLLTAAPFVNPWPMGLTFFLGEMAGGFILITHDHRLAEDQHDDQA